MTTGTIIEVTGHMDFRGEQLRIRRRGAWVPAPVQLSWTIETEEVSSVWHRILDVPPDRFPTQATATLTAPNVRIHPPHASMLEPAPYEPFTFTYLSDQGWLSTSATCTIVESSAKVGTRWRIRPSDYIDEGFTFTRATPTEEQQ